MFRRLRRILFHAAAAGSALLLLAVLVLWPLSYFREDWIAYDASPGWNGGIMSWAGRFEAREGDADSSAHGFSHGSPPNADPESWQASFTVAWRDWSYGDRSDVEHGTPVYKFLGCEYLAHPRGGPRFPAHVILVPYSYVALLSAIMPTIWLLTRKHRRRKDLLAKKGMCFNCGYDLRAHKPGDKCPECRTPISTKNEVKA